MRRHSNALGSATGMQLGFLAAGKLCALHKDALDVHDHSYVFRSTGGNTMFVHICTVKRLLYRNQTPVLGSSVWWIPVSGLFFTHRSV